MASAREHQEAAVQKLKDLKVQINRVNLADIEKSLMLINLNDMMSHYEQALKKLRRALGMTYKKLEELEQEVK